MSKKLFTDELEGKVNKLVDDITQGIYDNYDEGDEPRSMGSAEIRKELYLLVDYVRSNAYKEIASEIARIGNNWRRLDDPSAKIACDVIVSAIDKQRQSPDVFKETLVALYETDCRFGEELERMERKNGL